MASSLAVEWATKGVRVNALRYGSISFVCKDFLSQAPPPTSARGFSPGYMMTKLTRVILSNDPELKVALLLQCPFSQSHVAGQRTWECQTPMGRVWELIRPMAMINRSDT